MFPLEGKITNSTCSGYQDQHPHAILYNILSCRDSSHFKHLNATVHNCHCEQRRAVYLKNPQVTCQVASSVLVKTICFMRSLPSFSLLPSGDQSSLLRHCWVPLFVLGLAQEKMVFEVTHVPNSSILRQILLGSGLTEKEAEQPTLAGVHNLRTCLHDLWNLDLSPKEYAYLKGALLFNPGKTFWIWIPMLINLLDMSFKQNLFFIYYSCQRFECLVVRWRPPTGGSESSPTSHPPPAPRGQRSLQPHSPRSLCRSDCQPQLGHRALLQAGYRQHKYDTFVNRDVTFTIRSLRERLICVSVVIILYSETMLK